MPKFLVFTLVGVALMLSQQHSHANYVGAHPNSVLSHREAKILHHKQRMEAEAAAAAASHSSTEEPDMWSIINQSGKSHGGNVDQDSPPPPPPPQLGHKMRHHKHTKSSATVAASNCPKCQRGDDINNDMTEDQLTELRIAFVKNQILKKLKLTERPQVMLVDGVPRPVAEGATFQPDEDEDEVHSIGEDFYAKTNQKIIFPQLDVEHCDDKLALGSSMCFRFSIPEDIERQAIESAELWVYKQPHISQSSVVFVVNEVETWNNNRLVKPIAIEETNNTAVWVKIKIDGKMKSWIDMNDLSHIIEVTCATCEPHPSLDLLRLDSNYRPFIVVNTFNNRTTKRQKRNVNCSAGMTSCCRDKLFISFAEIGWDDWILHPPGYEAYFCRGSCASAASITLSSSLHTTVMRKVMYRKGGVRNLELVPCCAATKLSPLQLFYTDSNHTATQKTLPNMVVEACGCM